MIMLSREEFDRIFKAHFLALKLYAMRFVIREDVALDIVQDVFYRLWKQKDEFTIKGSFRTYLYSAVYNQCMNHIKHLKVKTKHREHILNANERFEQFYVEKMVDYPETRISEESALQLKKVVEELPEQCKRIFLLSRKFGLKNREIAEFLGISLKVVEKQVSKALVVLRERILQN